MAQQAVPFLLGAVNRAFCGELSELLSAVKLHLFQERI
jgi:hypothetical protein